MLQQRNNYGGVLGLLASGIELVTGYPDDYIRLGYNTSSIIFGTAAAAGGGGNTPKAATAFAVGAAIRTLEPLLLVGGLVYLFVKIMD
jgi:hypothetical protein